MDYNYLKNETEKITLKNNIQLDYVNRQDSRMTKLTMVNCFNMYDYDINTTYLTAKMLLEGTSKHDHKQIADIMDFYGAEVDSYATRDANIFSFTVLNEYFQNIFNIFNEIFDSPLFTQERLEYIKEKKIENLKIENTQNSTKVIKKLRQVIYNGKKSYGNIITEEGINRVTIDDVRSCFVNTWLNNCQILITGPNTNIEYAKIYLCSALQNNKNQNNNTIKIEKSLPQVINIKVPDCQQVSIALGQLTIPVTHDDYTKFICAVAFLGGGYLGSRLMKTIREKKGLTYGISASIVTHRFSNFLCIRTSAKKDFKNEVLQTIDTEIEKLKTDDITAEELSNFKNYFCGVILSSFTNVFSQMDHLTSLRTLHLPCDHYYKLFNVIKNLTADDIRYCAAEYLNFKDLFQVFVG